jgi:apolipoprotein N-acyltransferase
VKAFVESLAARTKAPMLVGSIAIEDRGQAGERWFNGAFVIDPVSGLQESYYAKRHLVPFGEYVPLRPIFGWLSKFVPIGDDFQRGSDAAPLIVGLREGPAVVGPLICYEDIYPGLARSSARSGAELLCVLTNNAWYGEGGAAYQHAAHSVLRAVETRRPLLRCGNGGWSGWIDEFGNIRTTLRDENDSVYFRGGGTVNVTRDLRWHDRLSFYTQHGDWFVMLSACLVILAYYLVLIMHPPRPKPGEQTIF